MLSEIRTDWRQEVEQAYTRARKRLNEYYAGETVRAELGKWGLDNGRGPKENAQRTAPVKFEVSEVHTLEGKRINQPNFIVAFETPDGSTYYDPEDIEVLT